MNNKHEHIYDDCIGNPPFAEALKTLGGGMNTEWKLTDAQQRFFDEKKERVCNLPEDATDREKELVRSSEAGAILDGIAYKILSGDGSTWERGKKLTFVIDGDISRFTGIKVDGIPVSEKYYEVEAGSTVVTLKRGYQKKLDAEGEHTIKFQFADGEVDGIFFLEEASGFSLWALLIGLILALAAAAGGAVLYFRKKKSA